MNKKSWSKKHVQTYADCKQVLDNYKMEAVCIYRLEPAMNPDAQGMMNYKSVLMDNT